MRAGLLDGDADLRLFMGGEIVEHDDVAGAKRADQHLVDVGAKGLVIDRAIKDRRRRELGRPERRDDRMSLPVTARRVIRHPVAARTARVAPQQIGCDARFVDEHILARVMDRQCFDPTTPRGRDISAALFLGVYGFF